MLSKATQIHVFESCKIKGVLGVSSSSNIAIIVIKSLLLNVLVLTSYHLVSHVDVLGRLLKSHWIDQAADLEVKISRTDCTLTYNHVDCLGYRSATLILEPIVN